MGIRNNNIDPNATGNDGSIHFNGHNNNRYMGNVMSRNMETNDTLKLTVLTMNNNIMDRNTGTIN